jgi:two-component system KDP operon response regulator KdpE
MKLGGKWQQESPPIEESPFESDPSPADGNNETCIGQNRKILVVDDNPVVLKAFELKLKSFGFQVLTASEAATGISCALEQKPDLIVLDFNLPPNVGGGGLQWNGFTIMQWLRRLQGTSNTPVIIISSTSPDKLKDQALAAGAVAFFHKPVDQKELFRVIQKSLAAPR